MPQKKTKKVDKKELTVKINQAYDRMLYSLGKAYEVAPTEAERLIVTKILERVLELQKGLKKVLDVDIDKSEKEKSY